MSAVGEVQILSRRGTDLTDVFPDSATAVVEQVPDGSFLDAEVVVLHDRRLSFDALQHRMAGRARQAGRLATTQPASLVVFDAGTGAPTEQADFTDATRWRTVLNYGSTVYQTVEKYL